MTEPLPSRPRREKYPTLPKKIAAPENRPQDI